MSTKNSNKDASIYYIIETLEPIVLLLQNTLSWHTSQVQIMFHFSVLSLQEFRKFIKVMFYNVPSSLAFFFLLSFEISKK